MPNFSQEIPFTALNVYFFQEIVGNLHPSLVEVVTDLRYLHHAPTSHTIRSVEEFWPDFGYYYMCIPWILDDIFPMSEADLLTLGKALLLEFMDNIVTDNLIDGQLPNPLLATLALNELRHQAAVEFRKFPQLSSQFWALYDTSYSAFWKALAHESYCLAEQKAVYTMEDFLSVCKGKIAPYEHCIHALAEISGKSELNETIKNIYYNLFLADALGDDVGDWRDDAQDGRRSLPIVLGMQKVGMNPENFSQLSLDELESIMTRGEILLEMLEKALGHLNLAQSELAALGYQDSKLGAILKARFATLDDSLRRFSAVRLFDFWLSAMKPSS